MVKSFLSLKGIEFSSVHGKVKYAFFLHSGVDVRVE